MRNRGSDINAMTEGNVYTPKNSDVNGDSTQPSSISSSFA